MLINSVDRMYVELAITPDEARLVAHALDAYAVAERAGGPSERADRAETLAALIGAAEDQARGQRAPFPWTPGTAEALTAAD